MKKYSLKWQKIIVRFWKCSSQKISLEEIFLELTEDNKKDSSDTDNRIQTAEEAEAVIRESENMTEEADKHDSSL